MLCAFNGLCWFHKKLPMSLIILVFIDVKRLLRIQTAFVFSTGKFWLDGKDYPEFQSCKSKVPKWWRNYFCFAFLGFGTDVSPTPIKSVVLELFDIKSSCVKRWFRRRRNSVFVLSSRNLICNICNMIVGR